MRFFYAVKKNELWSENNSVGEFEIKLTRLSSIEHKADGSHIVLVNVLGITIVTATKQSWLLRSRMNSSVGKKAYGEFSEDFKYPILLPRNHSIVQKLIMYYHTKHHHASEDGIWRVARFNTASGEIIRPIQRLYPLGISSDGETELVMANDKSSEAMTTTRARLYSRSGRILRMYLIAPQIREVRGCWCAEPSIRKYTSVAVSYFDSWVWRNS